MPVRTFYCQSCNFTWNRFISSDIQVDSCAHCKQKIQYKISAGLGVQITERINNYWNKNLEVGLKEKLIERSREHMREHEMHDMIAKYGVDVLKNHPLMKDGRVRRKDE